MVELRKRPPPKESAATAPAAKRRASSKSKEPAAKPESSSGGIASKAKAAATKVKKAVAGPMPVESDDSKVPEDTKAPEAVVETGEAGLIPETAGTAPTTTTVPATAPATGESEASRPPATEDLENPPEKGAVDTAATSSSSGTPATFPLNETSIGQVVPASTLPSASLQTHTGRSLSPSDLLGSGKGTIIFTYPRASTPGCTQQVCLFRDNHETFSGPTHGYTVYGLSTDSVKANANFATKQKIQYELICDPDAVLTGALGLKKPGNAKGTLRGVVVIDAKGVVRVWVQAGPAKTVEVVKEFLGGQ